MLHVSFLACSILPGRLFRLPSDHFFQQERLCQPVNTVAAGIARRGRIGAAGVVNIDQAQTDQLLQRVCDLRRRQLADSLNLVQAAAFFRHQRHDQKHIARIFIQLLPGLDRKSVV